MSGLGLFKGLMYAVLMVKYMLTRVITVDYDLDQDIFSCGGVPFGMHGTV